MPFESHWHGENKKKKEILRGGTRPTENSRSSSDLLNIPAAFRKGETCFSVRGGGSVPTPVGRNQSLKPGEIHGICPKGTCC